MVSRAARNSLKLSFLTVISRVLGLVRDHYQAVFFGTGSIATAWEVAYMLPNMLRNLLAEGVMSQAFIPIYSSALKKSEEDGKRAASIVLGFLLISLGILVVIGVLIFPYLIPLYIGKSKEEASLTIELAQIMFVFIMSASLTAILSGISNTHERYVFPALSPILLNVVFISVFLVLLQLSLTDIGNVRVLAVAVLVGGFLQFILQAIYLYFKRSWPGFRISFNDPVVHKVFLLMAPAVLGAGIFQFNQLLDIAIASYFIPEDVGAIPALRYAHRLIQLPTGIIGVAISTAILPALVRSIRDESGENLSKKNGEELMSAISFSLYLTVPAAIGLFLLGPQILDLLFYGGAWDSDSSRETFFALLFYAPGIPFYSINKIATSSFYAYQDTRTPVKILLRVVPINFILNVSLVHFLFQGGIALSTAVTAILHSSILLYYLQKRMGKLPFQKLLSEIGKMTPLWILVSVYLLIQTMVLGPWINESGSTVASWLNSPVIPRFQGMMHVFLGFFVSLGLYFGLSRVLKPSPMYILLGALNRKQTLRQGK